MALMASQQAAQILPNSVSAISAKLHTAETARHCRQVGQKTKENRVKRSVTVAAAATAIVVVGLSGCSSDKKSSESSSGSSNSSSGATASSGSSTAKVTIDGKDQNIQGTVACTTAAGTINIAVGGASTGIGAVLNDANPPTVKSVGLGNVNGVTLGYTPGVPGAGKADVTKDGSKYKISGTATGVDMANPMQPVNKAFEIDVTCP
jgi:ipoprotein LpqH